MQRELTQAKSNLAAMLARMEPTPTTKFTKGTLAWPVLGPVESKFGDAIDKHLGTQRDGIIIRAVVGDPVQAPAKGRVAFAGWMRGYGSRWFSSIMASTAPRSAPSSATSMCTRVKT